MNNAFNVDISDISILPQDLSFEKTKLSEFMQKEIFTKRQNKKRVLDGKKLEEAWFSPITADYFISHKREDAEKARILGAYLQSKGKTVFIDSSIWGNISKLQRLIDDDYCQNDDKSFYIYDKRNKSTSYTHMLLANALLKTIAACENFIFLNTPNSINAVDIVTDTAETNSPWIYFEINVANALLKKCINENFSEESVRDSMVEMSFDADLKRFSRVNIMELLSNIGLPIQTKQRINYFDY